MGGDKPRPYEAASIGNRLSMAPGNHIAICPRAITSKHGPGQPHRNMSPNV